MTKEVCDFERPFDARFRDMMLETTKHLMTFGFGVIYGYTQSDEISLLMPANEPAFGRRVRKIISVARASRCSSARSLRSTAG